MPFSATERHFSPNHSTGELKEEEEYECDETAFDKVREFLPLPRLEAEFLRYRAPE